VSQDPVVVDSGHYKVEFQNERVRALRIRYGPGEKSVMHEYPATVEVFLNDASFRFTFPDGRIEEGTATAGEVKHLEAFGTFAGEHRRQTILR
jgi:hypothetical protein